MEANPQAVAGAPLPVEFSARVAAPGISWDTSCLDGDCALGQLAVDALCSWASSSSEVDTATICLIPSKWLGTGLAEGRVDFESLAEVVPPHMLAFVTMSVAATRTMLRAGQIAAWRSCPASPSLAPSWQASGLRFNWSSCDASQTSLELVPSSSSSDTDSLRVLTLAPALPLLGIAADADDVHYMANSAQHVLADYMRAHSPLHVPATRRPVFIHRQGPAGHSCAPSACAPKAERVQAVSSASGVAEFHAAALHDTAARAATSASMLLPLGLVVGCLAAWVRRRRRAGEKQGSSTATSSTVDESSPLRATSGGVDPEAASAEAAAAAANGEETAVSAPSSHGESVAYGSPGLVTPPFGGGRTATGPRGAGDRRVPLLTGSSRITSASELGN